MIEQENLQNDILNEQDSIQTAEETIKKRKRFNRLVKRVLLLTLLVIAGIVAGVFFIDQYDSVEASFENEYSKEYWNSLSGFKNYDELYAEYVEPCDYTSSKYVAPYSENATVVEKMIASRYQEELDIILSPLKTNLRLLNNQVSKLENDLEDLREEYNNNPTTELETKIASKEAELSSTTTTRDELQTLTEQGDAHKASLLKWSDYKYSSNGALGYKLLGSYGNYEFYLHIGTTTFKVVDKTDPANPVEWFSNPQDADINKEGSKFDVLKLWYGKTGSSLASFGSYTHSVSPTFGINTIGVEPNYAIKVFERVNDENKNSTVVQVWYKMEKRGIDYTYFPKYISQTMFEELIRRNEELAAEGAEYDGTVIKNIKELTDKNGVSIYTKLFEGSIYKRISGENAQNLFGGEVYYEYSGLENASSINISTMFYLYSHCGFTSDDLTDQNDYFQALADQNGRDMTIGAGNTNVSSFTIAIQYEISEDGLNVTIPGNSITELGPNSVIYVNLLEYFTAAISGTEGYTIIPDGSGAVLKHDNGKIAYPAYSKRVYTTDLSQTPEVMQLVTEDIMLPMYAVANTEIKTGVIADIIKGAAQLSFTADISGRVDNYNKNYFSIYYRESQSVKISTYSNPITKYTANMMSSDVSVDYKFLAKEVVEEGYSGIAQEYRKLLVERYNMQDKKDETDELVLDIDVLASYQFKNNFLGIVYNDKQTLTTYEQLKEMLEDIENCNVNDINVFYQGWRNTTLVDKSFKSLKAFDDLGKLKELREIESKENVTVYPYLNFGQIQKYQESFGQYHYNTRNVIGELITIYPYGLNTNVWNKKAQPINVLSPRYYDAFANSLKDSYTKLFKIGKDNQILSSISLDTLGSDLTGDYQKGSEMYKINAVEEQIKALEILKQSGIENINLYKPYDYAFKYVSNAKEIPYASTQYEILDYSIPFYQLVVNGLFDYSGESINANSEDGINYHIMKILETGSNISFTFSYDNSTELLTSDYNIYYYTHYVEWLEDVQNVYSSIRATGIEGARLVKHEYLTENVYKVTYENQSTHQVIEIIINYARVQYIDSVTGTIIPAKSYKVL